MTKAEPASWGKFIDFFLLMGIPPSSRKDWANAGLLLANMQKISDAADLMWIQATVFMGIEAQLGPGRTRSTWRANLENFPKKGDLLTAWFKGFEPYRDWLRNVFDSIVEDEYEAAKKFGPDIDQRIRELRVFGEPRFQEGHLADNVRVMARSLDAATGYIVALYLDPNTGYSSRLRKCAYIDDDEVPCGRFFLKPVSKGPGPVSSYCTPRHREEAKKQSQRKRSRKYREGGDHTDTDSKRGIRS